MTVKRRVNDPWTPAEEAALRACVEDGMTNPEAARALAAQGFVRTIPAIKARREILVAALAETRSQPPAAEPRPSIGVSDARGQVWPALTGW